MKKILIIRFSSFGDIVQCMSVLKPLKERFPKAQIHWLVRDDMSGILEDHPDIDKVISFPRGGSLMRLWKLSQTLLTHSYDLIYDAHSNLRSFFLIHFLSFSGFRLIKRSKQRFERILYFWFRKNIFSNWPYQGIESYLAPLRVLGDFSSETVSWHQSYSKEDREVLKERIFLIPSAAWEMKRWPVEFWKELILNLDDQKFALLGGPNDAFIKDIASVCPERVIDLSGKLSLRESTQSIQLAKLVVSNDTGFIHVADLCGIKGLSLIGPTAFGYPTNPNVHYLALDMYCRPCSKDGRGKCVQDVYKKCLVNLTPKMVSERVKEILSL